MMKFYKVCTLAYYQTDQFMKAYKCLRKVSSEQDALNWALLGCIINKQDDTSFYRSYMKRLMVKQPKNPFVLMLLSNNYQQK